MRILFAGSPEIAVPSLTRLAHAHEVVGVLTNPDRCCGRGLTPGAPHVKEEALRLRLPVFQPERLDEAFRIQVSALKPDILVVVAFGKIFGPKFLGLFPLGGINLHPSLLPLYRGCSPIPAVIAAGEAETGISVQRLALKMDAGDILAQVPIPLSCTETTETLTRDLSFKGADLLAETLELLASDKIRPVPQDESRATYCSMITKESGCIDWAEAALTIERKVRAFDPWPRTWTYAGERALSILSSHIPQTAGGNIADVPGKVLGMDKREGILIQTGNGILAVTRLQFATKKALDWMAFLNGTKDFIGSVLGGR
jgi:methionyl-tRNA formyltransferase